MSESKRHSAGATKAMKIDLYHIDSMDIINFEPIYRHLENTVMVADPTLDWLDFDRVTTYFNKLGLSFQKKPRINPDCVITTQAHKVIEIPEYKRAISMRLIYGLGEKNQNHQFEFNKGFDAILVPGKYSQRILGKYFHTIVVGFPKYDSFFRGELKKGEISKQFNLDRNKRTILYLPTWRIHSSIDQYHNAIKKIINLNEYNFIFKPHTVTVGEERHRIDYFRQEIDEGKMICLEEQIGLDKLFTVADIIIADAMSGAFWESVLVANLPTLALYTEGNFEKKNLEMEVHKFAIINNNPNLLMEDLKKVENEPSEFKERRKEWANKLISFRDGTAGKRAAEEIQNFIKSRKPKRKVADFMTIYPYVYLARVIRFLRFSQTQFKKKVKETLPILSVWRNYPRRYCQRIFNTLRYSKRKSFFEKTVKWLKKSRTRDEGIVVSSRQKVPYPEVTGYIIPTLYQWGEKELARDLTKWLISQQNEDGSFSAPDGTPYTFDTGQVIRGFVAALDDLPEVEKPLRKACDWLLTQVQPDGRLATPSTEMWGNIADDRIHLYVLPPLIEAGKKLNEQKYIDAAHRVLEYYKQKKDLTEFNTLSHFYAYIIEALCDLEEIGLAKKAMEHVATLQKNDGSAPAYKNVSWVCSPGLAQFAVIWYKLGMREYADKAVHYLEKVQNRSGGFYGSYGKRGNYFPKEEISWTAKFFLDAHYWKIKTAFNQEVNIFLESIDENDGRVQEILSFFGDLNNKKVVDIGCGKGRFLRILKSKFPNAQLYGLDISEEMLKFCPEEIETTCGSILDIRYPDAYFDCVCCVEALEHSLRPENAVKEMVRILKPGGKIIIIDKDIAKLGALELEPWEQWFKPEEIINLLSKYGVKAHYKPIAYEKHHQPDGLFIAWAGVKNA